MDIKESKFVTSNSDAKKCPAPVLPEYAFIGRSNVGKSSLINMLCNQKHLAKTSGTPGKTQLINHFLINNNWYLVDLPGYGYAKVSKSIKSEFGKIIDDYIVLRTNLMCLFVLIDSRHEPQPNDLRFINRLGELNIPFHLVFTKTDKLKPTQLITNLENYKQELLKEWDETPPIIVSSSTKKEGRDEILNLIEQINQSWKKPMIKKSN
jgi:GTP-binding protein